MRAHVGQPAHVLARTTLLVGLILFLLTMNAGLSRAAIQTAPSALRGTNTSGYAWGTNTGWINFNPTDGGVVVYSDHLEGYAWGENVGWIRMGACTSGSSCTYANTTATNYGVNNDGSGNLSGYAWGTNIGWINFNPANDGVTINPSTGQFDGYAWGESIGWIHFKNSSPAYNVVTAWVKAAATTNAATDITSSAATLNGTVNANNTSTTVTFEYGLTSGYGATVPATQSPVSGTTDTAVSQVITNLAPNTLYHFRVDAENTSEITYGSDMTFTTPCSSAIIVTSAADSGAGTLRQAIADVCAGGTITFDGDHTIPLSSNLEIDKSMTISGAGHQVVISGQNAVRAFYLNGIITVNLNNLTISDGTTTGNGGGIHSAGGTLNLTNSTLSGNSAGQEGGGIFMLVGYLNVTNSTFSGNQAVFNGGGVSLQRSYSRLYNNSFANNSAGYDGGSIYGDGDSSIFLMNTLMVKGVSGGNCSSGLVTGLNNLMDDNSCREEYYSPLILTGALGNHGGDTLTIPLLPGSTAIDAGHDATCAAAAGSPTYGAGGLDQRGISRSAFGAHCDIGSFESQGFTLAVTGGDNQSVVLNMVFANPLALSVIAIDTSEPVNGGQVTLTAPAALASTNPAVNIATIASGAISQLVTANGTAGGPYTVIASAAGATSVNFSLRNINAPTASTDAASSITSSAATLNGTVNANNDSATVTFEHGLDTSYGKTVTATQSPVTGTSAAAVSKAITGLTPNTTYHFRVVASNTAGPTNGSDLTFTTSAIAPTAVTNAATAITSSAAILNGTVNANNTSATVTFEYGLDTGYGKTVTAQESPIRETRDTPVTAILTGLTPNTTYHFRVVVTNSTGTTYGADQVFTTNPYHIFCPIIKR